MDRPKKYVLRNISRRDIMLGDLRYKIPANQIRDLLSRTAHLDWEEIKLSREQGSIAVRLGKSLIELSDIISIDPNLPRKEMKKGDKVAFPNRTKSIIALEVGDNISDEIADMILADEDEFLKKLDAEALLEEGKAPLLIEDEEKTKD